MNEFNKGYYRRQGKAEGVYIERERIITLLNDKNNFCGNYQCSCDEGSRSEDFCETNQHLIELIKGETNG
jgi:hypothetical protein